MHNYLTNKYLMKCIGLNILLGIAWLIGSHLLITISFFTKHDVSDFFHLIMFVAVIMVSLYKAIRYGKTLIQKIMLFLYGVFWIVFTIGVVLFIFSLTES